MRTGASRLLLGAGGFTTAARLSSWRRELADFLGPARRVLFVPYALAGHDGYLRSMSRRLGLALVGIHRARRPVEALARAEALLVGGGNTFRLLRELRARGLLEPIRSRVRAGLPYVGSSAGTNVACPTIGTTNDMPISDPGGLEALGLAPFQINPHYFPGRILYRKGRRLERYAGETRDDRIREFHEENDRPVLGLWEGSILRVEGGRAWLAAGEARLFRKGRPARDLRGGAELSFLLRMRRTQWASSSRAFESRSRP